MELSFKIIIRLDNLDLIHERVNMDLILRSCLNWIISYHHRIEDVRAHCYCASLARTLFIRYGLPRHVFQARAPSRNSTKYRADDLCVNLLCEYFCWMLGDPHFFFGRSFPFLILSVILKDKKKNLCVGSFLNYFSLYYSHKVEFVHGYRCA